MYKFPTEDEIFHQLTLSDLEAPAAEEETKTFSPEEPIAVVWDTEDDKRYWCVGFYIRDLDDDMQFDHLTFRYEGQYQQWIRPDSDDVQLVKRVQVLPMAVRGEWDFNRRQSIYRVDNFV